MTARELAEALIGHFKYNPFESISGRLVAVEKALEQYGRERYNQAIGDAAKLAELFESGQGDDFAKQIRTLKHEAMP